MLRLQEGVVEGLDALVGEYEVQELEGLAILGVVEVGQVLFNNFRLQHKLFFGLCHLFLCYYFISN